MAATLMYIKSRMLLPADPDDEDEAEEDPRAELVQQLLEYQRYREAAADARRAPRPRARRLRARRASAEPAPTRRRRGRRVRDASLADLLDALREVLARLDAAAGARDRRAGPVGGASACERILARFALADRGRVRRACSRRTRIAGRSS